MFTPVTQPAEIETVARLAREIWTTHYTPIIGTEQVEYMLARFQSVEAIRQQLHSGMIYMLMPNAAGYFAYEKNSDPLFLSKIYVHQDFRRQGLARKAIAWIQAAEAPHKIRLTVNRHNQTTLAAYQKLGFKKVGEQVADIGDGYVMDDFVMEK
ncbi:GNAT family N-acetyltransferase [Kiritimatiellaeota bacterium B1221]|nr:GNAT family N-acetyltransferase [Kiritimatiellaeota bacterium B1221]